MSNLSYYLEMVYNEGLFGFLNKNSSSNDTTQRKPDPEQEQYQKKEYDDIIAKHKSKLMNIARSKLNSCKNSKVKKCLQVLDPTTNGTRGVTKDYSGNYYYGYDILIFELHNGFSNPREAMQSGETEVLWPVYNDIKKEIKEYCNKHIPNAKIDDNGDWDIGYLEICLPYTGDFI